MNQNVINQLLQHEAFKGLSDPARIRLQDGIELLSFELGQQLVDPGVIPGRVLILIEGRARLVGNDQGRLISLGKFDPGAVLGAASLLCGRSCENLIASDALKAAAIGDELWAHLYQEEESFRRWCDSQLWGQEVIALMQDLQQSNARAEGSSLRLLPDTLRAAERVPLNPAAIKAADADQRDVFLVSAWNGSTPGTAVQEETLPAESKPFPSRLISLPRPLVEMIISSAEQTDTANEPEPAPTTKANDDQGSQALSTLQAGPTPVSRFDPSGDVLDQLRLIRAEGVLQETLACFQMLAQLMKLPVRRDAIDKVLRETIRRGQTPNLRLCGQIAAGLGLHVSGARVGAAMGTRLQTPTLIPWGESFAVVARSNQNGLTLASPRDGIVNLQPEQLEDTFPEGIDLLLLDRTNTTPNETFGPNWFWPALKRHRAVLVQVLVASFV
ncbi:MAG: peptidase C39, partial [Synechococcus sp. TMED187]